ncbi:hypothetical protein [Flavisphingomonas formosensis]|uniref:hypothetical protein n=1 Tax=Flavisphingomonas formosensis TaxID=861534 RepID=UPI0012FAE0BC|nr:hypothetical protein [Sphingomonas formosensis]
MRDVDSACPADVRIALGERRPFLAEEAVYQWGGGYALRLGKIGDCWSFGSRFEETILVAADGRSVTLVGGAHSPSDGVVDVLARRILPRVATLFGATALHGASLAKGDAGILLLGASGAGKSTTTGALAMAGWSILSDDVSIVRNEGEALLEPCTTGFCIWTDSLAALRLDERACVRMAGYDGKLRHDPETEHRLSPARLSACVVLTRSPDARAIHVERLGQAEALMAAIRQLVVFNPVASHEDQAMEVNRLNAVMAKTPAFRLTYPDGYSHLPAIEEALSGLLNRQASPAAGTASPWERTVSPARPG